MPSSFSAFRPLHLRPLALACSAALMSWSGVHAQATPPGTAASAPGVLPAVTVRAKTDGVTTEGTGSYTTRSMSTATRLNLSPRETPQSVSVMTRDQMDDLQIQSIEDLSNSMAGLTLVKGSNERGSLNARGFSINYFSQDGLPMSSNADTMGFATLAMYDRVELLRGAAGMLNGAGNPSGTLNLVRKRPTSEKRVAVTASAGRWDDYRVEVDAGGALNDAGTVRARGVLATQDKGSFVDGYEQVRELAYGTVEVDLAPATTLSVAAHHNREENNGSSWYGLATQRNGTPYPNRSMTTAPDWAFWNKTNTRLFAELEHRFDSGWKVRLAGQGLNDKLDSLVNQLGRENGSERLVITQANGFFYDRAQRAAELGATGPFTLLGRQHDLTAGLSFRSLRTDDRGVQPRKDTSAYVPHPFDPVTWNPSDAAAPDNVDEFYYGQAAETTQKAAYATARFRLARPLALLLGARYDSFKTETKNTFTDRITTPQVQIEQVTPYAGLVFDLNRHWSAYGSWTQVFNPQTATDINGKVLDPVTGTNLETGLKGEFFDGRLNVSAAVFRMTQENLPLTVPIEQCDGVRTCVLAAGEARSEGFELEAAGALSRQWQLSSSFTLNSVKYTQDSNAGKAGTRMSSDRPMRLLKVATMYTLPGALSDWRIGGAVRAQSAIQRTGSAVHQGGYAVVDLNSGWQASRNLQLHAGITNVLDREYLQSVSTVDSANNWGEPRSFRVTARYTFD